MFSAVLLVAQRLFHSIEVRFTTAGNSGAAAEYGDERGGLAMFGAYEIGHQSGKADERRGEIAAVILADVNDPDYVHSWLPPEKILRPVN